MLNMDYEQKGITWVTNIYQKIEEVREEVEDNITDMVQNIGDSGKRICYDVIQELFPPLANSVEQELGTEESYINSFFESDGFNGIDRANNQQTHTNVSDDDDSIETSDVLNEDLHVSIEQNAVKSKPQPMNLTLNECGTQAGKEECSDGNVGVGQDSCAVVEENAVKSSTPRVSDFLSLGEREQIEAITTSDVFDDADYDSWGIQTDFSTTTSIMNTKSHSSPMEGTMNDDVAARDQCVSDHAEYLGSLSSCEVTYSDVLGEKSMTKTEALWSEGSLVSDNPSAKLPGSYVEAFEIESCKNNSPGVAGCGFDSSKASQAGLISSGSNQSMKSNEGETLEPKIVVPLTNSSTIKHGQMSSAKNKVVVSLSSDIDESLVYSIESRMTDIRLSDDPKLEHWCVPVSDSELHALSQSHRRRSFKKRIQEFFGRKKRLVKEYEQLAVWFGDADVEFSEEGASETSSLVTFRTSSDSSLNLQVQQKFAEWEIV